MNLNNFQIITEKLLNKKFFFYNKKNIKVNFIN